ncbi:glucuronyl hydrolase [Alistipes sp.]|uniref:glucuronyl hydrolase n=1 Tax=Alistipes sp. TaxID=1872444 RepID=UPI003AEFFEF6
MNAALKCTAAAVALAGFAACSQTAPKRAAIIDQNVAVAERQIGMLADSSETGGVIRIPSTYKNGRIDYVPTDDWVSGFFAGTLWYMYELTGDEAWAARAQKHTEILDSIQYLKWHHDVGFMIYDSYGNGLRLKQIPGYEDVIVQTARSLSTRFREVPGVIQSWDADRGWQGERGWQCPVIIDNMMNLEMLFRATQISGDSTFHKIAVSHADRTMKEHFRDDYSCYHVVDYDLTTGDVRGRCTAQGYADDSAWARGQAWAIYGFTTCYRFTGDRKYLDHAERVADFVLNDKNMPEDLVPYWDFDAPDIPDAPRDASTAAVVASAFYEMYTYTGNELYKQKADRMIESLSSPAYRAAVGENGGFLLMHSVGSIPHGSNIDVPLNYADYYFLEALIRKGRVEAGEPLF